MLQLTQKKVKRVLDKFEGIVIAKYLGHSRILGDNLGVEGDDNGEDLGVVMYEVKQSDMSKVINKDNILEMARDEMSAREALDITINESNGAEDDISS